MSLLQQAGLTNQHHESGRACGMRHWAPHSPGASCSSSCEPSCFRFSVSRTWALQRESFPSSYESETGMGVLVEARWTRREGERAGGNFLQGCKFSIVAGTNGHKLSSLWPHKSIPALFLKNIFDFREGERNICDENHWLLPALLHPGDWARNLARALSLSPQADALSMEPNWLGQKPFSNYGSPRKRGEGEGAECLFKETVAYHSANCYRCLDISSQILSKTYYSKSIKYQGQKVSWKQ